MCISPNKQNINLFIACCLLLTSLTACSGKAGEVLNLENNKSVYEIQSRNGDDLFLLNKYLEINNSPMQQKLRSLKPFPVGVVYYQQRGDQLEDIKNEFRIIKELGFTALKQIQLVAPYNPENFKEQVFHAAIEEGISPWYYGKAGWITITQPLLDSLGIALENTENNLLAIQTHPRMLEYQDAMFHKRVKRMSQKPAKPRGMGEPGRNSPYLTERLVPEFSRWLKRKYQTLDALKDAWNFGYTGNPTVNSFNDAAKLMQATYTDEFGNRWGKKSRDFRRMRDAMRFQADLIIENYDQTMQMFYDWDPEEPERTGGHQLFENQAINSWDLEAQARTAAVGGSFYSSIHLTHHFFLTDGEITRPVYMQSRLIADMFKGGWAATWESTGGPTQWSGHHNISLDGNGMKQLLLSYIAAGLKGVGIWMWNSRGEGWEAGEYALCDIQGEPTQRAIIAGQMAQKLQEQRFELWEAHDEPMVGILYSWENEAILGRLSMGSYQLPTPVFDTNRDRMFRQFHSEARIGISRALINHNIPFEYVTDNDILNGLANRYPVIYLPYMLAIDQETLKGLKAYVNKGGRLVADFPLMMLDNYGRLNKQLPGSDFEELFGFSTADYFYASDSTKKYKGKQIDGQYGVMKLSGAKVMETWDDGSPAIISHESGQGSTLVFNFEAARLAFKPGNIFIEELLVTNTLKGIKPIFETNKESHTMVFRRSAPLADHYFLINDAETETISIWSNDISYVSAIDVITEKEHNISNNKITLEVPGKSGIWIRVEKRR
jgi:beta-galactosidase